MQHVLTLRSLACLTLVLLSAGFCNAQGRLENGAMAPLHFIRAQRPVTIDGKLADWTLTAPVAYEVDANAEDRSVHTYAMWDDAHLYLAYVVRDATPMKNAGDSPANAFKTGDTLHFYLSTSATLTATKRDGGPDDYHILMTMLKGQPAVFAFREKKAGTARPTLISSPAQSIALDWMGPVPGGELAVELTANKRGYVAEVKLPLAFFDTFRPQAGRKVATDVAVNFSDPSGTTNLAKVWWHRGATQVLDIPSELRFDRQLWGTGIFSGDGDLPVVIDRKNLFVVPAPGVVTVDGDLGEWDLSCAYGPQYVDPVLKDKANVTWAMMYDATHLYLGAVFHAAQPYHNISGVENKWWEGDSLEFRLNADTKNQTGDIKTNTDILTFGVWYNPKEDKDYIALQRSFKFTISDISAATVRSKAVPGGRAFEVRVPWTLVQSGNYPKAGEAISCTLAALWDNGPRAYGMGSISSFRGTGDWGHAHFLPLGHAQPVYRSFYLPTVQEAPLNAGQYKSTLTVAQKGLLSAGVYSADGRLLRTLCAGRPVNAGPVEIGWDGKDDLSAVLPAGQYAVRAVINTGLRAQYVTSACSPGKPPHASPDPKRGWGGVWDNVKALAADRTGLYPLWGIEEGDGGLLKIDEDGNLLWRQHLPLAIPGIHTAVASNGKYVYIGVTGRMTKSNAEADGKGGLWRVRADTGSYVPFPHDGSDPLAFFLEDVKRTVTAAKNAPQPAPSITGLAADATTIFVAAYYQDAILCLDAETGKVKGNFAVAHPQGICLDGPAHLLVVSEGKILRLDGKSGQLAPMVTTGLDAPHAVAVDTKGLLLVTDGGASQQVKRFDRRGKLISAYGVAGGRTNNGKYVPDHLNTPAGIAVAASGKVFFSEDSSPRVFTRLSADLKYETQWAGPWYLSGEVAVDPARPEHVYIWSHHSIIRFLVDYTTKTSRPDAVWTDFALPDGVYGRWFPRIVHHAGKTYLFCGGTNCTLFRIDGDKMLLIAAVGVDRDGKTLTPWTFTDRNENGVLDPGEKVPAPATTPELTYRGSYWGGSVDDRDLTLYVLNGETNVQALTPTFAKAGVPVYTFATARVIPLAAARKPGQRSSLSSIWHTPDGGVFGNADANGSDPRGIGHSSHLSDVFVYRLDKDGNLLWRAGKKASGIAKNGEFYGRACGLGGPIANDYFSFVDENGQDKVFTTDGLFVGNLLDDTAIATPSENTLFVEHFNSIVYQNAQNKRWYFVAGAGGYASIWEIVGLDGIARVEGRVEVK
jgi:hypothetical protein